MHKRFAGRVAKLITMASVGMLFGSGCGIEQLFRVGVRSVGGIEGLASLVVAALTGQTTGTGTP